MRFTSGHRIPCLEIEDYAGFALYMKCLAELVEARVVADQAAVDAMLERPVAIWTQEEVLTPGTGVTASLFPGPSTQLRWQAGVISGTLNLRGWWHIGLYVHCVSDAPVVNNHRTGQLYVWQPDAPTQSISDLDTSYAEVVLEDVTWESNTTDGEDLLTSTMVYNNSSRLRTAAEEGMHFTLSLATESGGAENVTFSVTVWAIFMGDTPLIPS
jgi:hypothetical protein